MCDTENSLVRFPYSHNSWSWHMLKPGTWYVGSKDLCLHLLLSQVYQQEAGYVAEART